jgi:hypothetical protein
MSVKSIIDLTLDSDDEVVESSEIMEETLGPDEMEEPTEIFEETFTSTGEQNSIFELSRNSSVDGTFNKAFVLRISREPEFLAQLENDDDDDDDGSIPDGAHQGASMEHDINFDWGSISIEGVVDQCNSHIQGKS